MFHQLFDAVLPFIKTVSDITCDVDKTACDTFFPHDRNIVGDIGGRRTKIIESSQIGAASDRIKLATILQEITQGDEVHRLTPVRKLNHGAKDFPMTLTIKVNGFDDVLYGFDCVIG